MWEKKRVGTVYQRFCAKFNTLDYGVWLFMWSVWTRLERAAFCAKTISNDGWTACLSGTYLFGGVSLQF